MSLLLGLLCGAESLLTVRSHPRKADIIVVLGGNTKERVAKAIDLYQHEYAEKILVTGRNEKTLIGNLFLGAGIPEANLIFEPASRSTYENALFCRPYLRHLQVDSLLLVTSWFHSRRAAAVFRSITGVPELVSVPSQPPSMYSLLTDNRILLQVLKEYFKLFGYWVRYGISPISENCKINSLTNLLQDSLC